MNDPKDLVPLPKSKWTKHCLLSNCPSLVPFLPDTQIFRIEKLMRPLPEHASLIIKPEYGEGGHYVCKVQQAKGLCVIRSGTDDRGLVVAPSRLKEALPVWIEQKTCIVQECIDLAPYKGRPTDIRTIVQRNESGKFELTGTFVKTAKARTFVTNVKQGGTIASTDAYLRSCLPDTWRRRAAWRALRTVSLTIGDHLGAHFANCVYGIDLGLDRQGRVWIIEVNTEPNLAILGELSPRMKRRALYLRRVNRQERVTVQQTAHTTTAVRQTRR